MSIVKILRNLSVIEYNKKLKVNVTNIFHFVELEKLCDKHELDMYCSTKLLKANKRHLARMKRIRRAFKNAKFKSRFWTQVPKNQMLPYQAQAVNVTMAAMGYLEGDDMGLGKTPIALGVICKAFEEGYRRAVIVCPDKNKDQWKNETHKFTRFKKSQVVVVDTEEYKCPLKIVKKPHFGRYPCRGCEMLPECKSIKNNPKKHRDKLISQGKIVIVNYHAFATHNKEFIRGGFDIIILDEATGRNAIKNHGTGRSQDIMKIGTSAKNGVIKVPMSGTFIENKVEDIFNSLRFVDQRIVGNFYNFKNKYLERDYFGNITGYKNEEQLKKLIKQWVVRRTIDEAWPDRPPLIRLNKICKMGENQRDFYERARDAKLRELKDLELQGRINTANIAPLIQYLIQICDTCEAIDPENKDSCKMDYLKEMLLDEIRPSQKVVIFSFYAYKVVPIIVRELKALNIGNILSITGNTRKKLVEPIKQEFQNRKDSKVLVLSDCMAYGGNLQSAEFVINFDMYWNPAVMNQRYKRVYRRGQKKQVKVINLLTTNTVEDRILEVVTGKEQLFDDFLGSGIVARKKFGVKDMIKMLR